MCSVINCKLTRRNNTDPAVKLHSFPKNKERAMQWAINCERPDLIEKTQTYPNSLHVCSRHFERVCFNNDLKNSLTRFAIPTILNPDDKNTSEQQANSTIDSIVCKENIYISQTLDDIDQNDDSHELLDLEINADFPQINEEQMQDILDDDDDDDEDKMFYKSIESPITILVRHASSQTNPFPHEIPIVMEGNHSRINKICRLCAALESCSEVINIFGKRGVSKEYQQKINKLLPSSLQVVENDFLPQWICNNCCDKLEVCDETIKDFVAVNERLQHMLQPPPKSHAVLQNKRTSEQPCPIVMERKILHHEIEQLESAEDSQPFVHEFYLEENFHKLEQLEVNDTSQDPLSETDIGELDNSIVLKCLQCKSMFSDKASLVYHEVTKHNTHIDVPYTFDGQHRVEDSENLQIIFASGISSSLTEISGDLDPEIGENLLKRKAEIQDIEIEQSSLPTHLQKDFKLSLDYTENEMNLETIEADDIHLTCHGQSKKKRCNTKEPVIQSSHVSIPSLDSKTFLCHVCKSLFDTIESLLTHRFLKHPQEEISQGRFQLKKK